MKKSLVLAIFLSISTFLFAQGELLVKHNDKGLFLEHTVVAKETFYSVGRLYHLAPKDIAVFNNVDMNKGLVVGQKLQIPLNKANFTQAETKGKPVYYVVGAKEGLYRVSQNNNDVTMASLRKWNKLANDNISTGQKLIVGYLNAGEATASVPAQPEKKPVQEEKKTVVETKPIETKPAAEERKPEPVKPAEEKKPEVVVPRPEPVANRSTSSVAIPGSNNGGYFRALYEQQVKSSPAKVDETASAGIFKTSSGWQDGKFYALMDKTEPGTIIKLVNPTNNKVIYAKVLGPMSGIRQNQGYDLRISNAAASVLDVSDTDKFIVRINY